MSLNNDNQVRKQCFSMFSREFSSHGGSGMLYDNGFKVSGISELSSSDEDEV